MPRGGGIRKGRRISVLPVTAGLVLDEEGRVLVAQRPAEGALSLKWEFPGGKLRAGESPEQCLRRELLEELGIDVAVEEVFHIVHHEYAGRAVLLMAYRCRWRSGEIRLREHADFRWVPPKRLQELDLAGADVPIARKLMDRCGVSCSVQDGGP